MEEIIVFRKVPVTIRLKHPQGFQWSFTHNRFGVLVGAMGTSHSYQRALTDAHRAVGEVLSNGNNIQR